MASNELKINVNLTGLGEPLVIIIDKNGHTQVYEHEVKQENIKSLKLSCELDELPILELFKLVK